MPSPNSWANARLGEPPVTATIYGSREAIERFARIIRNDGGSVLPITHGRPQKNKPSENCWAYVRLGEPLGPNGEPPVKATLYGTREAIEKLTPIIRNDGGSVSPAHGPEQNEVTDPAEEVQEVT